MTTFGTSAYLKLLALNPAPRDSEVRRRLSPRKGGYDFHKQMRRIATEYASGAFDWKMAELKFKQIKRLPERTSAISAAIALRDWVNGRPINLISESAIDTSSPNGIYAVRFWPDFQIDLNGTTTNVHIWNTFRPSITLREAIGTLGLFIDDENPASLAILCLRTKEIYQTTDVSAARELARILALDVERRFIRISTELAVEDRKDRGVEKRPKA
mgnify:CR=1 FL=1